MIILLFFVTILFLKSVVYFLIHGQIVYHDLEIKICLCTVQLPTEMSTWTKWELFWSFEKSYGIVIVFATKNGGQN